MIFFFAAVALLVLASETYVRSLYNCEPKDNDSVISCSYKVIGGFAAPISALLVVFSGFFLFAWWIPLLALFGCSYVMGMVFARLMWDYEVQLVLGAFPLGIACALFAILL